MGDRGELGGWAEEPSGQVKKACLRGGHRVRTRSVVSKEGQGR